MTLPIRKLCTIALTLGILLPVSCTFGDGGDSSGIPKQGGGVGAACTENSECTGYSKPSCITEIKPLENLVDASAPNSQLLRDFTIPFPGGYCSNTIENSCAGDADCGQGAGCFLAFEGVPQATVDALNAVGLPFDVSKFASLGICMKKCTVDSDCRTDQNYKCMVPLADLLEVFNEPYSKKFCVQDVDTSFLLLAPDAG